MTRPELKQRIIAASECAPEELERRVDKFLNPPVSEYEQKVLERERKWFEFICSRAAGRIVLP